MLELLIGLPILVFSAILHEIAHGYVADRLGDPTARLSGRLTLDPRPHIDPLFTLLFPSMLFLIGSPVIFGGAKPVPVDPYNLKEGRKDLALVALAGPLTNIVIAIIAAVLLQSLRLIPIAFPLEILLGAILSTTVTINLLLAIFNLVPIPPLDGSKIFSLLLPEREAQAYMHMGMLGMCILFFLLLFPIGGFSLGNLVFGLLQFARSLLGL
jgi:Zn-dependent protease